MWDVVEAGALLQITAGSLTGAFGRSPQKIAELCVEERLIHFIASDAHDTKHRPFGMQEAYETVIEMADEGLAHLVCCENPARVFEGDDVNGGIATKKRSTRRSGQSGNTSRSKSRKSGFGFGWFGR